LGSVPIYMGSPSFEVNSCFYVSEQNSWNFHF
jgi:hypothetical protein